MRRRITILFLLLVFIVPLWAQLNGNFKINEKSIQFDKTEDKYDHIRSDADFTTAEPGHPELPVYTRSYLVPLDAGEVTIHAQSTNRQQIKGKYTIYPSQPPRAVSSISNEITFVEPDKKLYASTESYPGKIAKIVADYEYMGYRIVTIELYPFEYIPKSKALYYHDISYTLHYSTLKKQAGTDYRSEMQSTYRYELNKLSVKAMVENPEDVDEYDTKVKMLVNNGQITSGVQTRSASTVNTDIQIPEYIIITSNEFKPAFQPLAEWKTKKGIFSIIKTVEEIYSEYNGNDAQEKIRNYIISAKHQYGPGLYILLGGGIDIIPARMVHGIPVSGQNNEKLLYPTDMYYATYMGTWNANKNSTFNETGDGDDYSLGVLLSRVPAETIEEITTFTNKVITYEKANNITDLNYLRNNLYTDAYLGKNGKFYQLDIAAIKKYAQDYTLTSIRNRFICDNADCSWDPATYTNKTCPAQPGDVEFNRNNFLTAINSGGNFNTGKFHFIYHMDHCGPSSLGTSNKHKGELVRNTDFAQMSNGNSYQILMTGGCKTANFYYNCIAKTYLVNPNGGGVAWIGNTDVGLFGEHTQLQYFLRAIYNTPSNTSLGRYDIGSAYQNIVNKYQYKRWRLHLLGEPEMQIWTDIPQRLNVTTSCSSLPCGENTITVNVGNLPSNAKARICLYKKDEVFQTANITGNGSTTLSHTFTISPLTRGEMYVTVTAHNCFPEEKTITVTTSPNQHLYLSDITIDDDKSGSSNGNSNGLADAGETIELMLQLKNNGLADATGVNATINCVSSSPIDIQTSTVSFGNIPAGESKTSTSGFVITIDKEATELLKNASNGVSFELNITDADNNLFTQRFGIDIFNSAIALGNKAIAGGSTTITAGQTVNFDIELINTGKTTASGVTAILSPNTSSIASCSPTPRHYPDIAYNETKKNTLSFQFTTASTYQAGNSLSFNLQVQNEYGKTWNYTFNLLERPASTTGFDFTATTETINMSWNKVSNCAGYNIYRCNVGANGQPTGEYVKVNESLLPYSYYIDEGLGQLCKYYYRIATVSGSGNETLSAPFLAWTSYGQKYNFPVTMEFGGMREGVNTADINQDGYQDIFVGSASSLYKMVGLDHQGEEFFDIDNNVTSKSGFADIAGQAWGTPAIGDLDNDGRCEIVSATYYGLPGSPNKVFCFSTEGIYENPTPVKLWEKDGYNSLFGVTLSNIDNSTDGSLEVVVSNIQNKICIYSADGTLLRTIISGINESTYNAVAVADMDFDGQKEIIRPSDTGIYIWKHNGTPFMPSSQPIYNISGTGYKFKGVPVICDIDNDGEKEILVFATKPIADYTSRIRLYAIRTDGTLISGWNIFEQQHNDKDAHPPHISVGDLDHNGKLEIVFCVNNTLYVLDNTGIVMLNKSINGFLINGVPILADVDGDPDVEIVFASLSLPKVFAFKMNGDNVLGFPLSLHDRAESTVCVTDIDNDGKSELLVGADDTVYMFGTNGNPANIEWGRFRHNQYNTGEYKCPSVDITTNETWSFNKSICGDVAIKSGTLTINNNCHIDLGIDSEIIVYPGSKLIVDGARVNNTGIRVMPGGSLEIRNNGVIKLRRGGEFTIDKTATCDIYTGSIENP